MLYLPNYARALRCIGQTLHDFDIEIFELKTYANDFRLKAGDPRPPYTALIELTFSPQKIEVLDREGQARRGRSSAEVRFDTVPEMLRAIGEYIDSKKAQLRRIDSCSSVSDVPTLTVEYVSRTGEPETEDMSMRVIHDACVRMYKRRTQIPNPIDMLIRKR